MPSSETSPEHVREEFERKTRALIGGQIKRVMYYDIHNYGPEARVWDLGDWHHAVMGVELETDRGPWSVLWTNTFDSYGVEVFSSSMSEVLSPGPEGPEGWSATDHAQWSPRLNSPIRGIWFAWDTRIYTPMKEVWNKSLKKYERFNEASYSRTSPVAMRLDFEGGPVWIVAATVEPGKAETAFVGGDELMVVFSWVLMQRIGFTDDLFRPV
jgi:hypothetical protein